MNSGSVEKYLVEMNKVNARASRRAKAAHIALEKLKLGSQYVSSLNDDHHSSSDDEKTKSSNWSDEVNDDSYFYYTEDDSA